MVINLISSPRTISTALMYSFAQRSDAKVIDEPFYAFYLDQTKTKHPGFDEIVRSQPTDLQTVLSEIDSASSVKHLFLKGMAHHLLENYPFLTNWKNIILIRDPAQIIGSFSKVIHQPTIQDVGIKRQWELFNYLTSEGTYPVVIDSNELLKNPSVGLSALCRSLGIPFESTMLQWKPGPIPEDGVWAKYWYVNVHQSSGFEPYQQKTYTVAPELTDLLDEATTYFKYLSANRLF